MSTNPHLSVAEYERTVAQGAVEHLNRKIELIREEICEMNPGGPVRDDLIAYLNDWSVHTTERETIRVSVQTGLDVADWHSRPKPDLPWV